MWMEHLSPQVMQLVAPWFDEVACVLCLSMLRQRHIVTNLIGLKPGIIKSQQGVRLQPDAFLNQRLLQCTPTVLILPFGQECAALALANPRLHQLAQATIQASGKIAVPQEATNLVYETGLLTPKNQYSFIYQGDGEIRPFVQKISHSIT